MDQPLLSTETTVVEPRRRKRRKRRRRCKRHPKDGPHSPNCRGQKNVVNCSHGQNLVRILPTMKPILDYLQVTGEVFTREEIMGHLTEYIKRKSLFDPEDPRKVYCENDELAVIFGCNEFSTSNACELLLRNLQAINNPSLIKQESHSSEWSVCGSYSCNSSSYVNKYLSVSTTDTCSCSESDQQSMNEACSSNHLLPSTSHIVGKDGTGSKRRHDGACSDTTHPVRHHLEPFYGIGYMLSGYNSSLPSEGSERPLGEYSQHYKHVCGNVTDIVSDTSDDLFFLNETDEDPPLADEDQFLVEYEPISYSEEEQLIDESRRNNEEEEVNSMNATEDDGEDGGDELGYSDADSEIEEDDKWQCESCPERNCPMTRHCRRCWALRKNWCPPPLNRSISDPVSLENNIIQTDPTSVSDCATTSHNIEQTSSADWGDTCYICQKEPRNGCIVHGNTGHQVCCVGCAKQLKQQRKPCPVCHKKINRVIENFL